MPFLAIANLAQPCSNQLFHEIMNGCAHGMGAVELPQGHGHFWFQSQQIVQVPRRGNFHHGSAI
jgi:hypothetical protein